MRLKKLSFTKTGKAGKTYVLPIISFHIEQCIFNSLFYLEKYSSSSLLHLLSSGDFIHNAPYTYVTKEVAVGMHANMYTTTT